MLNWSTVLTYVKGNMALPSSFIEKTDAELKEWIKLTSLKTFSQYFPDDEYTSVIVGNTNYQHSVRDNWYYFFDSSDCDIIGIKDCYMDLSNSVGMSHPIQAPSDFGDMRFWSLEVFKSRFFFPFSDYSHTTKFRSPNLVEVLPDVSTNFVVWYERVHYESLQTIPAAVERDFMDLALFDTMINIGNIRIQYGGGNITTPWGDIPLRGEEIKDDGEERRRELLDKWEEFTIPPVMVNIG